MQEGTPIIIKKKKAHGHAHHGGAWKVAYADFVTAMMAFFMVMWILGMSDSQKEAIAAYFNDPIGFQKRPALNPISPYAKGKPQTMTDGNGATSDGVMADKGLQKVEEEIDKAIQEDKELKDLKEKGDIHVTKTAEGLLIELIENDTNGEVFFEVGSSVVRDKAKAMFHHLGPILASSGRPLEIQGHTDARPFPGSGYDNYDLSADRAQSVRRLLMQGGVTPDQVLSVEGRGSSDPRKPSDPNHFSNRRVAILLPWKIAKAGAYKLPVDISDSGTQGAFVGTTPMDAAGVETPAEAKDRIKSKGGGH